MIYCFFFKFILCYVCDLLFALEFFISSTMSFPILLPSRCPLTTSWIFLPMLDEGLEGCDEQLAAPLLLSFKFSVTELSQVKKFKSLFTLKVLCPMIKGCILDSADSGLHKKYLATMKSTSLLHGFWNCFQVDSNPTNRPSLHLENSVYCN